MSKAKIKDWHRKESSRKQRRKPRPTATVHLVEGIGAHLHPGFHRIASGKDNVHDAGDEQRFTPNNQRLLCPRYSSTLQRHHIGNPPESDERIEVVVRIPEEVAKTLAGGRKPSVVIFEVGSRVRNVATETAGVPNDSSLVIVVVSTVDAVMPPSLPTESNFKDQDGAEGWIL